MIPECVRLVAGHLSATLPAVLAATPRHPGDPLPVLGPVLHEISHGDASAEPFPEASCPAVVVTSGVARWTRGMVNTMDDFETAIDVRWMTAQSKKEDAARDAGVVMRALWQALVTGCHPADAADALSELGVTITGILSFEQSLSLQTVNHAVTASVIRLTLATTIRS
jgi:hypothetical protein